MAYINALRFETRTLEQLLDQDTEYWNLHLEAAKKEAAKIEAEVAAVFDRSQRDLNLLMNR